MRSKPGRLLFVGGALLFLFHFGCTIGYILPRYLLPVSVVEWSTSYMYPAFYQGWSLFAPDVAHWQGELYYRSYSKGKWSAWQSTTVIPGYSEHPKLIETAEKLNTYLCSQLHEGYYVKDGKPRYEKVVVKGHYKSAIHYAMMHLQKMGYKKPDSLQLRMEIEYFPAMNSGDSSRVEVYDYPKLEVPKE